MKILILFYSNFYFLLENALVTHETYFQITFGSYLIVIIITNRSSNKEYKLILKKTTILYAF